MAVAMSLYGTAVLRLLLAAAYGAAVGWERERHDKAAGLRTHILLAIGACLFALVTLRMGDGDTLRVVQGILLGTGFICGGVIFRRGPTVKGLTTATGLWVTGAAGLAAGVGEYFLAAVGTALALIVIALLPHDRHERGEKTAGEATGGEAPDSGAD